MRAVSIGRRLPPNSTCTIGYLLFLAERFLVASTSPNVYGPHDVIADGPNLSRSLLSRSLAVKERLPRILVKPPALKRASARGYGNCYAALGD